MTNEEMDELFKMDFGDNPHTDKLTDIAQQLMTTLFNEVPTEEFSESVLYFYKLSLSTLAARVSCSKPTRDLHLTYAHRALECIMDDLQQNLLDDTTVLEACVYSFRKNYKAIAGISHPSIEVDKRYE